jgi:translation initiation factor IF-3
VDQDGNMVGVVSKEEALSAARKAGLDLVEVSPNASPPVCKILDYGKFRYEQQKKKSEAKKKQKTIEIKEIQMRPMIDTNDIEIKCRAITRFLSEGNKVKIIMRFRGREMAHQEIGMNIINKLKERFADVSKMDYQPKLEGKQIIMIISPK